MLVVEKKTGERNGGFCGDPFFWTTTKKMANGIDSLFMFCCHHLESLRGVATFLNLQHYVFINSCYERCLRFLSRDNHPQQAPTKRNSRQPKPKIIKSNDSMLDFPKKRHGSFRIKNNPEENQKNFHHFPIFFLWRICGHF